MANKGQCRPMTANASQQLDLDFKQILVDDGDQDKWDKSVPGLDSDWFL
jgi:hypothetical protein